MVERGRDFPTLAGNRTQISGNSNYSLVTTPTELYNFCKAVWRIHPLVSNISPYNCAEEKMLLQLPIVIPL